MKCQISAWRWLDFYCTFWKPSPSHFEIWPNDFFELVLIFFITRSTCCCHQKIVWSVEIFLIARIFLRVDIVTISVLIATIAGDIIIHNKTLCTNLTLHRIFFTILFALSLNQKNIYSTESMDLIEEYSESRQGYQHLKQNQCFNFQSDMAGLSTVIQISS